jgi:phosphatidate cytidylyltransferase
MAPLSFFILYLGGMILAVSCLILSLAASYEFFRAFRTAGIKPSTPLCAGSITALYYIEIFLTNGYYGQGFTFWLTFTAVACFLYMFNIRERRVEDGAVTFMGIIYTGFLPLHIFFVYMSPYPSMIWLIFLSAFGTDIFAYLTGRAFGRHKLCPGISPKKTVEGAIGGLIGGAALCSVFGYILMPHMLAHCAVIGIAGGIFSQLGDLTASIFKRKLGIKDYGNLIPGHGGILDRIDSVIFTAPVVYYYIALVLLPFYY